ncbi:DUF6088 family protein [Limnohabitans sp.]|uniref:DUF6088 family protein n=1 Tax=Limnohabitans sp. TaxID=1907725 RepID=UPI00286F8ED5|nr:DUF6088 family protein [Limnohabitans sp.]
MTCSEKIRAVIASLPQGAVFSSADFLSAGTRAAVDQTLYRMVNASEVVRIARGLYAVAGDVTGNVAGDALAVALAHKTGEHVGGALPHASNAAVVVVPTSGQTRTVMAGGQQLAFRRMSQRKIKLSQTPHGRVLLGLWTRGAKALTTLDIQQTTGDWPEDEIDAYAALVPAWLRTAVKQSNAPKKSVKIGLSGPYDWSNPHIKDKVLIGHVLEKHRFEDVLRLCLYYGVAKVKRVFKHCAFDAMTSTSVARMLRNIHKGLTWAKEGVHAQA